MEEKFEIKITEKTDFKGVTYYYLYVNGTFQELARDKKQIEMAKNVAIEVYQQGKHIETVLELITL